MAKLSVFLDRQSSEKVERNERDQRLRPYIVKASASLSDEDALNAKELFDLWDKDKIYYIGNRVLDGEDLYKCRQSHTSQAIYPPHLVPALWTLITLEPGTHDNPIHYGAGMELEEGKYYTEDDILYICTRSTGIPVYNPLSALVGIYVEVAE